jgi:pimeloyl-ACP methyl ester carboxylesterase
MSSESSTQSSSGSRSWGFVAPNYAVRHPEHPAGLVLSSTAAHIHLDRSFVERLGGSEARELAERFWTNPRDDDFDEYARVCFPLYAQRAQPPEVLARITRNTEVAKHFRSSGEMRFDLRGRLDAIRCPVLSGGRDDRLHQVNVSATAGHWAELSARGGQDVPARHLSPGGAGTRTHQSAQPLHLTLRLTGTVGSPPFCKPGPSYYARRTRCQIGVISSTRSPAGFPS